MEVSAEYLRALAASLRLAASLLDDEPSVAQMGEFVACDAFCEAPVGNKNVHVREGLANLSAACLEFAEKSDAEKSAAVADLARERFRLFVGAGAPDAPCWATFYLDPNNQMRGSQTLGVRVLYRAHGLAAQGAQGADDRLGLMMAFAAVLLEEWALACERTDTVLRSARGDLDELLCSYMLPWLPRWSYLVQSHASSRYYRGAASLTFGLIEEAALLCGVAYNADKKAFVRKKA